MNKRTTAIAYVEIVIVNIIWGLSFIASKAALESGFQPFTLAAVRFLMSTTLLLPVVLLREGMPRFTRREWVQMLLGGVSGISLYFLFEYKGLLYTTAGNASLILAAIPVIAMLVGVIRQHIRYSAKIYAGVLGSLAGVYLVVRYGAADGAPNALLGNLFLLGACLCWVAYIELTTDMTMKHSSLSLTFYQGLLGMLTLIPLCFSEQVQFAQIAPVGWLAAAFLGILCSAIAYIMYADAMRSLDPLRTSMFINLNPVAAVLGGVLLLNETVTPMQMIGGALIMLSILYVNWALAKGKAA